MITKKEIEAELGYEITDFDISTVFNKDGTIGGYSVRVVPKQVIKHINVDIKVTPNGVEFEDV